MSRSQQYFREQFLDNQELLLVSTSADALIERLCQLLAEIDTAFRVNNIDKAYKLTEDGCILQRAMNPKVVYFFFLEAMKLFVEHNQWSQAEKLWEAYAYRFAVSPDFSRQIAEKLIKEAIAFCLTNNEFSTARKILDFMSKRLGRGEEAGIIIENLEADIDEAETQKKRAYEKRAQEITGALETRRSAHEEKVKNQNNNTTMPISKQKFTQDTPGIWVDYISKNPSFLSDETSGLIEIDNTFFRKMDVAADGDCLLRVLLLQLQAQGKAMKFNSIQYFREYLADQLASRFRSPDWAASISSGSNEGSILRLAMNEITDIGLLIKDVQNTAGESSSSLRVVPGVPYEIANEINSLPLTDERLEVLAKKLPDYIRTPGFWGGPTCIRLCNLLYGIQIEVYVYGNESQTQSYKEGRTPAIGLIITQAGGVAHYTGAMSMEVPLPEVFRSPQTRASQQGGMYHRSVHSLQQEEQKPSSKVVKAPGNKNVHTFKF
jgi:hypothetical protein